MGLGGARGSVIKASTVMRESRVAYSCLPPSGAIPIHRFDSGSLPEINSLRFPPLALSVQGLKSFFRRAMGSPGERPHVENGLSCSILLRALKKD